MVKGCAAAVEPQHDELPRLGGLGHWGQRPPKKVDSEQVADDLIHGREDCPAAATLQKTECPIPRRTSSPRGGGVLALDGPGYVLGAMLPDLAAMTGARLPGVGDATVAKGVASSPDRRRSTTRRRSGADERSTEAAGPGLERGRARAVAHVGVRSC
jgi:hypothetical protein